MFSAAQHQQPNASQGTTSQNPQRRNFMRPDVPPQTVSKGLDLPLPPIIANGLSFKAVYMEAFHVGKMHYFCALTHILPFVIDGYIMAQLCLFIPRLFCLFHAVMFSSLEGSWVPFRSKTLFFQFKLLITSSLLFRCCIGDWTNHLLALAFDMKFCSATVCLLPHWKVGSWYER